MSKVLDGKILAKSIIEKLNCEVLLLKEKYRQVPCMVNIIVGTEPGSCAYAKSQKRIAQKVGIDYRLLELPEEISQEELIQEIKKLDADKNVNGILIHKPIPPHIDYAQVANCVDISKDLEGINVTNIGKMVLDDTKIIPCTPAAIMEHIKSTGVNIRGKEAVIVGHSQIVGKPLGLLLLNEMATVTTCHVATSEAGQLEHHVKRADILIVAVGKTALIHGDIIKEGAIVIDVGINNENGKIVGDVDYKSAKEKASFITPVPGGVGPVTVTMLMRNAIEAFKAQN